MGKGVKDAYIIRRLVHQWLTEPRGARAILIENQKQVDND
jgi:hypothetical protein